MDDDPDDKDDSKRKSRNLSEKKRRDQFNLLVNELSSMVSVNNRKMDKSTVLKSTIAFLLNHNEVALRSRTHEIQENWKPTFLSNEEFTHLILEALDGFMIVFAANGQIYYASESITSLLGHLPSDLLNMTIYDLANDQDHSQLYNILLQPNITSAAAATDQNSNSPIDNQISFTCYLKRGQLDANEEILYEPVHFIGYFRSDVDIDNMLPRNNNSSNSNSNSYPSDATENSLIFVGTGRLMTPQLIREMSIVDSSKSEFTSRHSLEWKFLFLDHRAPPIIGYLPFEVLGTSGYDYYHFDDLDKVILCHEALMQKGEGTSCYYRFLTKGQQWIWLQTRFYITYHQWNSKPEFVVCTHRVVSYADVARQYRNYCETMMGDEACLEGAGMGRSSESLMSGKSGTRPDHNHSLKAKPVAESISEESTLMGSESKADNGTGFDGNKYTAATAECKADMAMAGSSSLPDDFIESERQPSHSRMVTSPWSSRSSKASRIAVANSPSTTMRRHHRHRKYLDPESDSTTSMSTESHASRQSMMTQSSSRSRTNRPHRVTTSTPADPGGGGGGASGGVVVVGTGGNRNQHQISSQLHHHSQQHQYQMAVQHQLQMQNTPQLQLHPRALQRSPQNVGSVTTAGSPIHSGRCVVAQAPAMLHSPATFLEPPAQYLTAISVQPVLAPVSATFATTNTTVISPMHSDVAGVIMTPAQKQIQDQLQRKHEQLQQLIVQQQEELRMVSEQLLMARYGIIPPIVNVCYSASSSGPGTGTAGHLDVQDRGNNNILGNNNSLNGAPQLQDQTQGKEGYGDSGLDVQMIPQVGMQQQQQQQMVLQATSTNNNQNDLMGYGIPHNLGVSSLEMMPYQQAHVLFGQDISPNANQMNSNSGGNA